MDEMNWTLPPELDDALTGFYAAPEPSPAFASRLDRELVRRQTELLQAQSVSRFPLWKDKRRSIMQTLRARPALAFLILLLALSLLSGVAYAVGKSLGYIPGVGIVDQNASLRVLEGPVTETRDGITVTVKQAFLTSDKTVLTYTVDGVPWSALSHNENVVGCSAGADLHLPDGTLLKFTGGGGTPREFTFNYPSIPANVSQATFVLPCIMETLPGLAPENWELPLRFIPAPPNLIMPVIEVSPSPEPQINTAAASKNPLALLKVVDTGDNYVLLGEFRPSDAQDPSLPAGSWLSPTGVTITDAEGRDVFINTSPNDPNLHLPYDHTDVESWAYQIGKTFTPPLTITYTGRYTIPADPTAKAEFAFDAGTNPQPGQEWVLNQDFELAGHTIRLVSIQMLLQSGYGFSFESSDPAVQTVNVDISGYIPHGRSEPVGGNAGLTPGKWSEELLDYDELPKGKLNVVLSNLTLYGEFKTWQVQWSPETPKPGSPSLYGISLAVDQYIPLDDGYYLIGHTEWTDERITSAWPTGWALKAYDAKGQEVAIEPANWQDAGLTPEPNQWLYRLTGKSFNSPLTLRATQMDVTFKQPVKLTLDLRSYGFDGSDAQLGMVWKSVPVPLDDVPGLGASVFKVIYIKQGELKGFEIVINADPALQGLPFSIESGLNTAGMATVNSGGGSSWDETSGLVSTVLTDAKITFPLVLSASGATVNATWETTWNPPAGDANTTPLYIPQACVTLDKWKQAAGSPEAIPSGLPKKVLVSRGALSPDPSLFISSLDGASEQGLVFGQGSLSPDGAKLVYSGADNRLYVRDFATGQNAVLTNGTFDMKPLWSPDGNWIAFNRLTNKGWNIFVVHVYKGSPRLLTDTTDNPMLAGWMPDSRSVIFVATGQEGNLIQTIDVESGAVRLLVTTRQPYDGNVSISPDGWIAYADKVPGRMAPGIFISRLDGSEKRLLVQLDYWMASNPLWTPDGKWLVFNVMDTDQYQRPSTPAIVNVETCQVIPLTKLKGEIREWVNR